MKRALVLSLYGSPTMDKADAWWWTLRLAFVPTGPFDTEQEAIDDAQSKPLVALCIRCGQPHVCYACGVVHDGPESDNPNCNPDDSGNPECSLRAVELMHTDYGQDAERESILANSLPPCVVAMGCYCAGHARGNPTGMACDTSEQGEKS